MHNIYKKDTKCEELDGSLRYSKLAQKNSSKIFYSWINKQFINLIRAKTSSDRGKSVPFPGLHEDDHKEEIGLWKFEDINGIEILLNKSTCL